MVTGLRDLECPTSRGTLRREAGNEVELRLIAERQPHDQVATRITVLNTQSLWNNQEQQDEIAKQRRSQLVGPSDRRVGCRDFTFWHGDTATIALKLVLLSECRKALSRDLARRLKKKSRVRRVRHDAQMRVVR